MPADRMAATIKGHLNRFVNEGNNITNAKEMEEAICSHGGIPGVRVAVLDYLGEREAPGPQRITGISKLNNFRYFVGGVRVWQAFDIGPGKEIHLEGTNGESGFDNDNDDYWCYTGINKKTTYKTSFLKKSHKSCIFCLLKKLQDA